MYHIQLYINVTYFFMFPPYHQHPNPRLTLLLLLLLSLILPPAHCVSSLHTLRGAPRGYPVSGDSGDIVDAPMSPLDSELHPKGGPPSEAEEQSTGGEKKKPGDEPIQGFAFFPATAAEQHAASTAPSDPNVQERKDTDGQPWDIPHGLDLGQSSMLTGDAFMQHPVDHMFNPHINGIHTPPAIVDAPYVRL